MNQLLTVNKLAEYYDVSRDSIYRWIREWDMPYETTPSGKKRFDIDKITEWKSNMEKDF